MNQKDNLILPNDDDFMKIDRTKSSRNNLENGANENDATIDDILNEVARFENDEEEENKNKL